MHVRIDPARCQGHGKCYLTAPAVFRPDDTDDWGRAEVLQPTIRDSRPDLLRQATIASTACPEFAIHVTSEELMP